MKLFFLVFSSLSLFSCSFIQLRKTASEEVIPLVIPLCSKANLKTNAVPEGFECLTTQGHLFKRVRHSHLGMAWVTKNGVVWSDRLEDEKNNYYFTQDQGLSLCSGLNAKLPTDDDFKAADAVDFLEVSSDFGPGNTYWTSSMAEGSSYYGKAVSSVTEIYQYGDVIIGHLKFIKEPVRFIPFLKLTEVKFKIRCISDGL